MSESAKIEHVKPFWCLEVSFDADLESLASDEAAVEFSNEFLAAARELIGRFPEAFIHMGYHLRRDILAYGYNEGFAKDETPMEDHGTP